MAKKCVYCSVGVDDACVVDMCERCMYQVWGDKMAKTIIENMERERDAGNLELWKVGSQKAQVLEVVDREEEVLVNAEVSQAPVVEEITAEELAMEDIESSRFGVAESL